MCIYVNNVDTEINIVWKESVSYLNTIIRSTENCSYLYIVCLWCWALYEISKSALWRGTKVPLPEVDIFYFISYLFLFSQVLNGWILSGHVTHKVYTCTQLNANKIISRMQKKKKKWLAIEINCNCFIVKRNFHWRFYQTFFSFHVFRW